jgi:hypothetical protein
VSGALPTPEATPMPLATAVPLAQLDVQVISLTTSDPLEDDHQARPQN